MSNVLTEGTGIIGRAAIGGGVVTYKLISIKGAGSTAEQDTTFDIPQTGYIFAPPFVRVDVASSAGSVLDVGLLASESGGDADGFLDGIAVATTGTKQGTQTVSTSGAGSTGAAANFLAANTVGVFLSTFKAGTTFLGDPGLFTPKLHPVDSVTAKSLSWTLSSSTDTSFKATIVVPILEFQA